MASNQTQNYGLNQWELTDNVRMEDFNSDNAKIDAALAGATKIVAGSYIGTGTYGSSSKNKLTFDFEPKLVIMNGVDKNSNYYQFVAVRGATECKNRLDGSMTDAIYMSWAGNRLSWYSDSVYEQFNQSGATYYYVALG